MMANLNDISFSVFGLHCAQRFHGPLPPVQPVSFVQRLSGARRKLARSRRCKFVWCVARSTVLCQRCQRSAIRASWSSRATTRCAKRCVFDALGRSNDVHTAFQAIKQQREALEWAKHGVHEARRKNMEKLGGSAISLPSSPVPCAPLTVGQRYPAVDLNDASKSLTQKVLPRTDRVGGAPDPPHHPLRRVRLHC